MSIFRVLGPGKSRELGTAENALFLVIATLTGLGFLSIAAGVYIDQTRALHWFLGAVLSAAFLTTTGNADRPRVPTWSSWTLTLLSIASCAYMLLMQPVHALRLPMIDELTPLDLAVAGLLIVLILEATRRTIGLTLVILVVGFLAYATWGHHVPGSFSHRELSVQEMMDHMVFTPSGLFGSALEVAAFLVFVFVAFGALLDRWGGGDFFYDLANSLVGRQVGGSAKVAVVSSGLYGTISGSPTADVVTTGSFTIPLMIRMGLTRTYSGAIEAVASTGGAILPPVMGSAAFLMSDFTGIPYASIALAAIVPALLYYLSIFLTVHFRALKDGLRPPADLVVPRCRDVIIRDWYYFLPLAAIVWGVLRLDRPAYAGALAIAALLPIALYKDRGPVRFVRSTIAALAETLRRMTGVGVACAVAGLVVGTLGMTDLTGKISSGMFALATGSKALTLIIATIVTVVLGMGMPTPAVYALSAVLTGPALMTLGIDPLPAHLFIVYFASLSAITPPVAVASFAAASIANANPMHISVLACRIGAVAFALPYLFIYQPGLLLSGGPVAIATSVLPVIAAVVAWTAAFEGYLVGPIAFPYRVSLIAAGVCMLLPFTFAALAGAGVLAMTFAILVFTRSQGVPMTSRE